MARHAAHYLGLLDLPFQTWTRSEGPEALASRADHASHVLVLVSDRAIVGLLADNVVLQMKTCVHFSGSVTTPLAFGAHPLMTFSKDLYSLDEYRKIPFVLERDRETALNAILPGLPNASFSIESSEKPLYHALCAMAGNYTVMLWEKIFASFEGELGLPKSVLIPYLQRITQNLAEAEESVLTGPLVRGDRDTVASHLAALANDPYADVYRAFVSAYDNGNGYDKGGSA
ncbi:MAG: DUF2520 domain-containing protein [Bdellovibrionota bacterium]